MTIKILKSPLAIVLAAFLFCSCQTSEIIQEERRSTEEMQEILDFVVSKIQNAHPKALEGIPSEVQQAMSEAREKITASLNQHELFFVLAEMLASLHDAHSFIEVKKENLENYFFIDLPFVWLEDGIVITKDTEYLRRGDLILDIAGKKENEIMNGLRRIISTENNYHIKATVTEKLIRNDFLKQLGLLDKKNKVQLKIERSGKTQKVVLPLGSRGSEVSQRQWFGYTIESKQSLGIFYLDRCDYSAEYALAVKNFFEEVAQEKTRTIVIDLRQNIGGNIIAGIEFMRYFKQDYRSFSVDQRRSAEFDKQYQNFVSGQFLQLLQAFEIDIEKDHFIIPGMAIKTAMQSLLIEPEIKDNLRFDGNIYTLISPVTFSSGNLFATLMKDNNLGKVIGEPTGNAINMHGQELSFEIPGTPFRLNLASSLNVRADESKPNESALFPDVAVPTRRGHILEGRDAQIEWIKGQLR